MSKSLGNTIGVTESASQMFGKCMSVPDPLMEKYFTLLTDLPDEQVKALLEGHPRMAKAQLARILVTDYHGAEAAERAAAEFDRMFVQCGLPDEIPEVQVPSAMVRVADPKRVLPEGTYLLQSGKRRAARVAVPG
jgi:tyrosyl-tRNA synthetase